MFTTLDRDTETPTDGQALPARLNAATARVLVRLHRSQSHLPTAGVLVVQCDGEQLVIPARTYYDEPEVERIIAEGGDEGRVALSLGTRHHNGYFRERCVRALLASDVAWAAPFIIPLLGEYVIEIVELIEQHFAGGTEQKYVDLRATMMLCAAPSRSAPQAIGMSTTGTVIPAGIITPACRCYRR